MKVTISDKAELMKVLHSELEDIERLQLKVGEDLAKLLFEQMRLAEKSRALINTMEALLK